MPPRRGAPPPTGKPQNFESRRTAGGFEYFVNEWHPEDKGFGYVLQDGVYRRYSLAWIEYVLAGEKPPRPRGSDTRRARTKQAPREMTAVALDGVIPVVYGTQRIGGNVFFRKSTSYYNLNVGYALCQGPIDSLVSQTIDGKEINSTNFGVSVQTEFFPGEIAPAAASSILATAAGMTTATFERYPALAYVAMILAYHQTWLPNYPAPLFTVKGRTLLDPRLGVDADGLPNQPEAWSQNPALAMADYYANGAYGLGRGVTGINWDSVGDVATKCDTLVAGLPRHTLNIALMQRTDDRAIVEMMRAHFRCHVREVDGLVTFAYDGARSVSFAFTESNSRPGAIRTKDTSEIANRVVVEYPDADRDFNTARAAANTDGVEALTESIREEVFALDGCNNGSEALRQAFYLLNKGLVEQQVELIATTAEAFQIEEGDRITYTSEALGLGMLDLVVERVSKGPGAPEVRMECTLYNEAIYSDATVAVETKPTTTLPDPAAALDPPTNVTAVRSGTRVTVDWDFDVTTPFYGGTRVSYSTGGGVEQALGTFGSGPVQIVDVDPFQEITVYARTVNANSGAESAAESDAIEAAALEPVVDLDSTFPSAQHRPGTIAWGAPRLRVDELQASGWSHSGLTAFDGAKVNDGDLAAKAFDLSAAGTKSLTLAPAAPKAFREVVFRSSAAWIRDNRISVYYSDDGVEWSTAATGTSAFGEDATASPVLSLCQWEDVGAHSFWWIAFSADPVAVDVFEVQFREYEPGDASAPLKGYNVYPWDSDELYAFLPFPARELAAQEPIFWRTDHATGGYSWSEGFRVAPVGLDDSEGLRVGVQLYGSASPSYGPSMAIGDGLNSDVETNPVFNFYRISGPTAAFSIGGLTGGEDQDLPRRVVLHNATSVAMTLLHEDVASLAANRFDIAGDADLVVPPGALAELVYDGASQRWIIATAALPATVVHNNVGNVFADGLTQKILYKLSVGTATSPAGGVRLYVDGGYAVFEDTVKAQYKLSVGTSSSPPSGTQLRVATGEALFDNAIRTKSSVKWADSSDNTQFFIYRSGSNFPILRCDTEAYTLFEIWSRHPIHGSGEVGETDTEATLALSRGMDTGQRIVMDVYNNGYTSSDKCGIRILATGGATFRKFHFDRKLGSNPSEQIVTVHTDTDTPNSITGPLMSFGDGDYDTGIGHPAADTLSFWAGNAVRVLVSSAKSLETIATAASEIPEFRRTSTSSNARLFSARYLSDTTADMIDNFGAGLVLSIRDSAGVINDIAQIVGQRDGADNTGSIGLLNYTLGSVAYKMILDNGGMHLPQGTAPAAAKLSGGVIYFDSVDGDLKVLFANGTTKTIATN